MNQRKIEIYEKRAGGIGTIQIERLMNDKQLDGKAKMYAQVTIDPHSSIGVHEHIDVRKAIISYQAAAFIRIMI